MLERHPSYGYRRIALALNVNKKRAQRVMRRFGVHAYRRRGRKPRRTRVGSKAFPNLLAATYPLAPNHVWAADFTYIPWRGRFLYLATVVDLFTREIVGWAAMTSHSSTLVLQALFVAVRHHARPRIFHSDNGREYGSAIFTRALAELGVAISRSARASPWQNGYQESFYSQFKVDLGDPGRFRSLGELVYEVHRLVWDYNHTRIHSALRMAPLLFAARCSKLRERVP